MANNYTLRTNPVTGERTWYDLTTGTEISDPVVIADLEAKLAAGCEADLEISTPLVLPRVCANVDGGDAEYVTPVSTNGVVSYFDQIGNPIVGTVVATVDPCECECSAGIAGPSPQANDDIIIDPVLTGSTEFVNVAANDFNCPDGQVTTFGLVAGSEDNVTVTDIVPAGNGVFSYTPIVDGTWSFDYEIFCDGSPSGSIATVSGVAETPIEILSCSVPFDIECVNPPTFTVNNELSDDGVVAAYSVTRDTDNQDFVVRLTRLQGSTTLSVNGGDIRVRLNTASPDALVLWEWFQGDGVTPVPAGFTAGFEVGDLDGPTSNEFMTLTKDAFCGIRANGTTVLDDSNPTTWTVTGTGGGTASANLQSAFSAQSTVITYGADSGGRNFNHNFGAVVAILDYVVTDLEATSTSTADPNLIEWSVVSSTNGNFSAGSFTQAEIDNEDITFNLVPGLVPGDVIAYTLQVTDPSNATATCSFSLTV